MASPSPLSAVARPGQVFLTAAWRHLVMLNYAVDPAILQPHVPAGVELDFFQGQALASIVGFQFLHTRVLGVPIPWHRNFEEVNLRFYVRKQTPEGWRRGVVFISELVPRWAIAFVARTVYGEPYRALPMRHRVEPQADGGITAEYAWRRRGEWEHVSAAASGPPAEIAPGSEEEFITEHYWGYTRCGAGAREYQVEHPRWRVWRAATHQWQADVASLYGASFVEPLRATPTSAFIAEGSPVTVRGYSLLPGVR